MILHSVKKKHFALKIWWQGRWSDWSGLTVGANQPPLFRGQLLVFKIRSLDIQNQSKSSQYLLRFFCVWSAYFWGVQLPNLIRWPWMSRDCVFNTVPFWNGLWPTLKKASFLVEHLRAKCYFVDFYKSFSVSKDNVFGYRKPICSFLVLRTKANKFWDLEWHQIFKNTQINHPPIELGGGFKYSRFIFVSPRFGKMIQFEYSIIFFKQVEITD